MQGLHFERLVIRSFCVSETLKTEKKGREIKWTAAVDVDLVYDRTT